MTVLAGKLIWVALVVGWYVLRLPHERRARRAGIAENLYDKREKTRLLISLTGLGIVPLLFVAFGQPRAASYDPAPAQIALGAAAAVAALLMFVATHKALGRNWSVSLQLKREHRLITTGIYRHVRHPMYTAFWLMALAQALLLGNWAAGPAGLLGFGILFAARLPAEEAMMEKAFGEAYRHYRARTKRVIPFVF